jgi:transcriptional regulator with XRE-family HTH domain
MTHAGTASRFGSLLKTWRSRRRVSQMDLALTAELSQRHVSFLEIGRSGPSRRMVERLADALEIPCADRDSFFTTAGFSAPMAPTAWSETTRAAVDSSLSHILESHHPYPALIVDRLWNLQRANAAAARFFLRLGGRPDLNVIRALLDPEGLGRNLVNRAVVAARLIGLVEVEVARRLDDAEGRALVESLRAMLPQGGPGRWAPIEPGPATTLHFRVDDDDLSLFSLVASVGFPREASIEDLKIETLLPADEVTRTWFGSLAD